ncbi:hypothetical protein F5B21DRAFT_498750 [Xylaria acuta]|nr:hypothetical protein F5B21DRAFT_498750 [Xylaria acuta]
MALLIGEAAKLWTVDNPETTICNPRALLGRRLTVLTGLSHIRPDLELRAQVNARTDLESYLATLKERFTDNEVWDRDDVVSYDKLGHALQRSDILRDIEMVQDGLIKYHDV